MRSRINSLSSRWTARLTAVALVGLLAAGAVSAVQSPTFAAEEAVRIPPPAIDEEAHSGLEKAVFAGGCFWGVQGVFQHVKGVKGAVSGYAGGEANTAVYQVVGSGSTGHAEAVEVTFDPAEVSYGKLLQVFFSVAHNPTQLNYQGPDHGTQYRSAIFPVSAEQEKVAQGLYRPARRGEALRRQGRHDAGRRQGLLPGRGLPSGFPDAQPDLPLHRLQRPAEDRQFEDAVSGPLPGRAGAGHAGEELASLASSGKPVRPHGKRYAVAGGLAAVPPRFQPRPVSPNIS